MTDQLPAARVFPLDWPAHRPRTPPTQQRYGRFSTKVAPLTISQAYERALREVQRIGGLYPILSSSVPPRRDGSGPRSDLRPVDGEVGVCLYFLLKGQPIALACDTYTAAEQNIAALAAHLEATRAIERYGVASAAESLQAFIALPPPEKPRRKWWEVFGLMRENASLEAVEALYRVKVRGAHPDKGGTTDAMQELAEALSEAKLELSTSG